MINLIGKHEIDFTNQYLKPINHWRMKVWRVSDFMIV